MGKNKTAKRDSNEANLAVTRVKSAKNSTKKGKHPRKKLTKKQKIIITIIAVLAITAGGVGAWLLLGHTVEEIFVDEEEEYIEPIYSLMTGLEIADEALNANPTYCVQIPNGSTDGARPQAGLNSAAIVFEAIAESGITRFAAIFQNADVSAIGPVRSLRPYYLDWDTPFDCTVVHAGGSDEAMKALRVGGQRELNESYTYMWREGGSGRNWNNLFTSPTLLDEYNTSKGWTTSNPKVFPRMTPIEANDLITERAECAEQNTEEDSEEEIACEKYTPVTNIKINFSANTSHNVIYNYDAKTNTYLRSHQDGKPHLSYECPKDLSKPNTVTECGEPKQVAPSVVIAMEVQQNTMADNYHQSIKTASSGKATIFQNGEAITGTWSKKSQDTQIVFKDGNGKEIQFTPGQLWISAVPQYGKISY